MQQKICHSALLTQKQKLQKIILSEKWQINNNYLPKWRWLVLDIYRTAKQCGKYPQLATDTEVNNCFSIY